MSRVPQGKWLSGETQIFDVVEGESFSISKIVKERIPCEVNALGTQNRFAVGEVLNWHEQEKAEILGLSHMGGQTLWLGLNQEILTERGWVRAKDVIITDRLARPRKTKGFGDAAPMLSGEARMLGYLIGDGYTGGKTPITFINTSPQLHADAASIAKTLGCVTLPKSTPLLDVSFSHEKGKKNELLALCREQGIWGKLAFEKTIPKVFFDPEIKEELVSNLIFGLLETDGWVTEEKTGSIRVGYGSVSPQLVMQLHWLLLRWGIASTVEEKKTGKGGVINGRQITGKFSSWVCRVSGQDNIIRFSEAIPLWGPRGQKLQEAIGSFSGRNRGGRSMYLSPDIQEEIVSYISRIPLSSQEVGKIIGISPEFAKSGTKQILGTPRIRRDKLSKIAEFLSDDFLLSILDNEIAFSPITEILPKRFSQTYRVEIKNGLHPVAGGVVIRN